MSTRKSALRLSISSIKWIVVIGLISMVLHVACLLFGINIPIAESLVGIGILPFFFAMLVSYGFGFCKLHRWMIAYIYITNLCISYLRFLGFGEALLIARILMLLFGIVLVIIAAKKKINCEFENKYLKDEELDI